MKGINDAYYELIGKLVSMHSFFIGEAWRIGRVVLLISICSAAFNYALTGTGLKENIVKMLKATVFFIVVMRAYPGIIGWITAYTYRLAYNSTYVSLENEIIINNGSISARASSMLADDRSKASYGNVAVASAENYLGRPIQDVNITINGKSTTYPMVAPAAMLNAMLLVAGECLHAPDLINENPLNLGEKLGMFFKGLVCAIGVIICGSLALLEYLVAYLEFMFVTAVGIIFFPLSMWDGSKFMAEKFIRAVLGFFMKLLFCTICIFLAFWGFLTMANLFTANRFVGLPDQILFIIALSLLLLYICKSAPQLAQSLMTGTPSLNAAGAIGTAVMAAGAVASVAGLGARAAIGGTSALSQAGGAAMEGGALAHATGGSRIAGAVGGFTGSLANSASEGLRSMGTDLTRSLLARSPGGRNLLDRPDAHPHSATARFFQDSQKSLGEFAQDEAAHGKQLIDNVS
jgi:hypothetical protein